MFRAAQWRLRLLFLSVPLVIPHFYISHTVTLSFFSFIFCCVMFSRIARFSNVQHLSIHISKNFGAESTRVYYIGLRGEYSEVSVQLHLSSFNQTLHTEDPPKSAACPKNLKQRALMQLLSWVSLMRILFVWNNFPGAFWVCDVYCFLTLHEGRWKWTCHFSLMVKLYHIM